MSLWDVATPELIARWDQVYGGIQVTRELYKMEEWLAANPHRPKKRLHRFIVNWLAKAQGQAEAIETRELVRHEIQRQMSRSY